MQRVEIGLANITIRYRGLSIGIPIFCLDQPEILFPHGIEVVELDSVPADSDERLAQLEALLRADGVITIFLISQQV